MFMTIIIRIVQSCVGCVCACFMYCLFQILSFALLLLGCTIRSDLYVVYPVIAASASAENARKSSRLRVVDAYRFSFDIVRVFCI